MHAVLTHGRVLLVFVLGIGLACCGASPPEEAQATRSSSVGQAYRVDLDAIFPAGEGRDLVLNNCQSCHVWVPIVVLQMNEDEWLRSKREHRERVESIGDEDFETLYAYLISTFTPDRPVPEIPPSLLEAWTTY